jgi:putative membrane protein
LTGELVPTGAPELRRLHPLSPYVHGWKWWVGLLAVAAPQFGEVDPGTLGIIAGVALPFAVVYAFLSWRFTRFGFDGGDLRLDSGILFRRSRRVRMDRLQTVDVVRPLVARALGLAELRLEVVGGGKAEAPLAYLSESEAQRLRAELLARAAGVRPDAPEAPEHVLHQVPGFTLAASALLSLPFIIGVLLLVVVIPVLAATGGFGVVVLLFPALYGVGQPLVRQFAANFDFTLAESPDGLRLRRGLVETRSQTVPPGRVQAVRLVQPWFWRLFTDWVRLEVNVAGYAKEHDSEGSAVLLPVASRSVAIAVLGRVYPELDLAAVPLTQAPREARWVDPVSWSWLGAGATDDVFVSRRGRLRRELDVIAHARVQSARLTQGLLQRRLGLATLHLDTTPGPVHVTAAHREYGESLALLADEVERARAARATARPDRWMRSANPGVTGDSAN